MCQSTEHTCLPALASGADSNARRCGKTASRRVLAALTACGAEPACGMCSHSCASAWSALLRTSWLVSASLCAPVSLSPGVHGLRHRLDWATANPQPNQPYLVGQPVRAGEPVSRHALSQTWHDLVYRHLLASGGVSAATLELPSPCKHFSASHSSFAMWLMPESVRTRTVASLSCRPAHPRGC